MSSRTGNGQLQQQVQYGQDMSVAEDTYVVLGVAHCFEKQESGSLEDRETRLPLPEAFHEAVYCEDFAQRLAATARTWLRPHAQENLMDIVPLHAVRSSFNYNTEQKRVLNFEHVVSEADNIKQDMSIDVYGRTEAAEAASKEAPKDLAAPSVQAAQKKDDEDDEDDMDALFAD